MGALTKKAQHSCIGIVSLVCVCNLPVHVYLSVLNDIVLLCFAKRHGLCCIHTAVTGHTGTAVDVARSHVALISVLCWRSFLSEFISIIHQLPAF